MGLVEYRKKRRFDQTPEPDGGRASGKKLAFVVQKHRASSLHYDFRLELRGVLLSWAVPKGPSLNPADKRLALRVEDHPFGYKDFEGIIPEGNYGAGSVIVWDQGTYEPVDQPKGKADAEKMIAAGIRKGSLKFRLHGQKLNGEFALVKTAGRGENSWLLIKHRDEFASLEDVIERDESVVSGLTIEDIADADSGRKAKRKSVLAKKTKKTATTARKKSAAGKATTRAQRNNPQKKSPELLPDSTEVTQVKEINGHQLKFTNLDKVFWPEEQYTKRDLLNYYHQVAEVILPYMRGRPQTLNRFPNGIYGKSFYQKDVTGKVPDWIETYEYFSEGDRRKKHFLVCTNEESLLYIASLGCIEMNPWSSTTKSPDHPDWCVIDLDPDKKTTFDQVIEAARVTKEVLDVLGVPSWCKTSGSTGIHIYIPLGAKYTYDESKEFGRALMKIVNHELPRFTTMERKVSDRKGRMYLDFLQNRPKATIAGPYSLRPKPGAPVSMPLHWDEVKPGLRMLDFTIANAGARIRSEGDLFSGLLDQSIDLGKAMLILMKTFGKINQ